MLIGEGSVMYVLKKLSSAQRDGDQVRCKCTHSKCSHSKYSSPPHSATTSRSGSYGTN